MARATYTRREGGKGVASSRDGGSTSGGFGGVSRPMLLFMESHLPPAAVLVALIASCGALFAGALLLWVFGLLPLWLFIAGVLFLSVIEGGIVLFVFGRRVMVDTDAVRWGLPPFMGSIDYSTIGEVWVRDGVMGENDRMHVMSERGSHGLFIAGREVVEITRADGGASILLPARDGQALAEAILKAAQADAEEGAG